MNSNDERMADEIFGDLIYAYTRAQALADGVLVDVSARARCVGLRYPTACTQGVQALIEAIEDPHPTLRPVQVLGRTDAVLVAMLAAIRQARGTDRVMFFALGASLWAQCGPGDTPEPVLTVMLEGED